MWVVVAKPATARKPSGWYTIAAAAAPAGAPRPARRLGRAARSGGAGGAAGSPPVARRPRRDELAVGLQGHPGRRGVAASARGRDDAPRPEARRVEHAVRPVADERELVLGAVVAHARDDELAVGGLLHERARVGPGH